MTEQEYDKTLKAAYHLVYDDIVSKGPDLFKGCYDTKHGNNSFMYGICTVMEFIADKVSPEVYDEFSIEFVKNMNKSEERALTKAQTSAIISL